MPASSGFPTRDYSPHPSPGSPLSPLNSNSFYTEHRGDSYGVETLRVSDSVPALRGPLKKIKCGGTHSVPVLCTANAEDESVVSYPPVIFKIWGEIAGGSDFPYNIVDDIVR